MLQNIEPPRKFKRIERAGWNDEVYALPSGGVIPEDDTCITTYPPVANFDVGGDKSKADELLAAIVGNHRLLFTCAVALSAPLVAHYPQAESGGFHFFGLSSRGKTTLLCCAASIWGCGAEKSDDGIVESWNTTRFAAEVTASQHSDCAMFFDEVREADPKHFASLALGIANGAGKKAGRSDGTLRESVTFRPTLLSTGEISAKDYIQGNGLAYYGGMAVRLVDIPADAPNGLGVFDVVPDEFNGDAGAFSKWIKLQAATHFGHHGRSLVTNLIADRGQFLHDVCEAAGELRSKLNGLGGDGDPQTGRVADRFAFVGAVSIVAARRNLVPWSRADVQAAVCAVFESWFLDRGGKGSQEGLAAEKVFTAFVYANPKRFDEVHPANVKRDDVAPTPAADRIRLGAVVIIDDKVREYWIANDEGLTEMVGNQRERIAPLIERLKSGMSEDWEVICTPRRNNRDTPRALKKAGLPKRCYCFRTKDIRISADDATNDNECEMADIEATRRKPRVKPEAAE